MPGGFGTFGCGSEPAGGPITPAGVTPTTLVASWQIDPETRRYVLDANGNPLGMDGTEQRVYWLVSDADVDQTVITPAGLRAQEAAFKAALKPLVDDGSITKLTVTATDDGQSRTLKTIRYTNTGTNLPQTVKVR